VQERPHTEPKGQLEQALARAHAPIELSRRPPASLRVHLLTRPVLRAAVPTPISLAFAQRRGGAAFERDERARERAHATITAIVAGTARAGEVELLAREHLIEAHVRETLFWRPWPTPRLDATSQQRVRECIDSGRPLLFSNCHLGPFYMSGRALCSQLHPQGRQVFTVAAPWLFQPLPPGLWGRRLDRWLRALARNDQRLVCSAGSYPLLAALLAQGGSVQLFFDMPGSRATQFLGKPVMLSTGSARLAMQAEALVLPVSQRCEDARIWFDVCAPLDARDFAQHEQLHDALARVHEQRILQTPASLEDPNRAGAWEGQATAHGWQRPRGEAERPEPPPPVAPRIAV